MKIHINAGHGGKDPGACGNGLQEKNITLKTALLLGEELKKYAIEVSYTRTEDIYISPTDIAKRANTDAADLFISLHTNASTSISANGIETLCYSLTGSEAKIAQAVQNKLIAATGFTDRGIKKRTDLVVLNTTKMPAILIELGFITSKSDSIMLSKESFLKKCAETIAVAVGEYYGIKKEAEIMTDTMNEAPKWQTDGLERLVAAGVIGDEEYWKARIGNAITVGEVLGLLGKMAD